MTFIKIAWRNLYRRPQRTILVLMGISVGVFCLILFLAMTDGMFALMIDTVIDNSIGHIQIHKKDYLLKQDVKLLIKNPEELEKKIREIDHVTGVSPRIIINGLVSSATSSGFGKVYGINPDKEWTVTVINKKLIKGEQLKKEDGKVAYIGKGLAEKLKVDVGDKIVIMAKDLEGDMAGSAFRVKGIYSTGSKDFEKTFVYITEKEAGRMLGTGNSVHEIAIRLDRNENLEKVNNLLKAKIDNKILSIETWKDLSPVIVSQLDMAWVSYTIFFGIIFISMAFGILNAFLMKIFERIKEFGIMLSLGTDPASLFLTIIMESVFMGIIGALAGGIFSIFFIKIILGGYMDLGLFGGGMEYVGVSNKIPLIIGTSSLIMCMAGTVLTTIIASILPALRAASFKPIDALRFI